MRARPHRRVALSQALDFVGGHPLIDHHAAGLVTEWSRRQHLAQPVLLGHIFEMIGTHLLIQFRIHNIQHHHVSHPHPPIGFSTHSGLYSRRGPVPCHLNCTPA